MQRSPSLSAPNRGIEPVDVVMSVFTARRDLLRMARGVLGDSKLSLEETDILVLLYGATRLGWREDFGLDQEGYATFRDLQAALVHEPTGFSRRVQSLQKQRLVETDVVRNRAVGLHGNSRRARITRRGISNIRPIFERYARHSAELLKGFDRKDLQACLNVLEHVSRVSRHLDSVFSVKRQPYQGSEPVPQQRRRAQRGARAGVPQTGGSP